VVEIFAFLELEHKLPFFKGLIVRKGLQVEVHPLKKAVLIGNGFLWVL